MKPICLIYLPTDYSFSESGLIVKPIELMRELNMWQDDRRHSVSDEDAYGGYMYWCFKKEGITEPEMQVFHPKDFTEANYEELKELLLNKLKEMQDAAATTK